MLTDLTIRQVTFGDPPKPKKLHDADGLYLLCRPDGARWWRFAYRYAGRHRTLSMGTLKSVSLAAARRKVAAARELLNHGLDPSRARRDDETSRRSVAAFSAVAAEWRAKQRLAPATQKKQAWLLETFITPALGRLPIGQVTARDIVAMAQQAEDRTSSEAAHRAKQLVGQILRYAVATGRAARDVTGDTRGALRPVVVRHRSAITDPDGIGGLLRAIDSLDAPIVRGALQLLALTFVRPGELRTATWADIDLVASVWRIPAARMKMKQAHVVPLAPQAVTLLKDLQSWTGDGAWVFPAVRTPLRPMSDGTINAALRRIGYQAEVMTAHGFRAMARTVLAEVLLADPFVIEAQLAHATPGPLGSAYARTQYLAQRRIMMATWAEWLDQIRLAPAAQALTPAV